jgi:DNA-binding protein Fis
MGPPRYQWGLGPLTNRNPLFTGSTMTKEGLKPDQIEQLSLEGLLERKLTGDLDGIYTELEFNCGLFHDVISIVERILIKMALKKTNNVQVTAAQFLGINRNTLRKKIRDLRIKIP